MESVAAGLLFLIAGIIACILASGCTLVFGALVLLGGRWWPPLRHIQSWQVTFTIFLLNFLLIFRVLSS